MKHRLQWVGVMLVVSMAASSCSSVRTIKFPTAGCYISCKDGRPAQFGSQHLCFGDGSRFFTDVQLKQEYIERNADGTMKIDNYITDQGDYPVKDVEPQPCSSYILGVIAARSPEQRSGPGETPLSVPDHK